MCPFVLQNQPKSKILDRLHQIMFKIIILCQIGAGRYQKLIFEILLLSPPLFTKLESCAVACLVNDFASFDILEDPRGASIVERKDFQAKRPL